MLSWIFELILISSLAWASPEDAYFFGDDRDREWVQIPGHGSYDESRGAKRPNLNRSLSPEEVFRRTLWILNELRSPIEPDSQAFVDPIAGRQTLNGFSQIIGILDPSGDFLNYLSAFSEEVAGPVLSVYQDIVSRSVLDYSVRLAPGSPEPVQDPDYFHRRLLEARRLNPPTQPLRGLRIALDPGHMGGHFWDGRTGKYIEDSRGRRLSEGVLALQTALLLERELRALGADVLLTRRDLVPVTSVPYADFRPESYGPIKLREKIYYSWFQGLLDEASPGPALVSAFTRHSQYQSLFASSRRDQYFILDLDLTARSDLISSFRPDVTLIIHFDTGDVRGHSSAVNYAGGAFSSTKAFVFGAASLDELATREDRKYFARHLLDSYTWGASLKLGRSIVRQLSSQLRIPYSRAGGGHWRPVEPGIFARNLEVSRKVTDSAVSYLECLHYNDAHEFARLVDFRHTMRIGQSDYGYSDRLVEVVQAIRQGIVDFAQRYGE